MKLKFTPFTILIDSREQLPYSFRDVDKRNRIVMTRYQHLKTGDYSLLGFESEIMIERKSLKDLYSTIGQEICSKDSGRFERELQRLSSAEFACVMIEASEEEVEHPLDFNAEWYSRMAPSSIIGKILSWHVQYPKVHWKFAGSRDRAEWVTFELLRKYYEQQERQKKEAAA